MTVPTHNDVAELVATLPGNYTRVPDSDLMFRCETSKPSELAIAWVEALGISTAIRKRWPVRVRCEAYRGRVEITVIGTREDG